MEWVEENDKKLILLLLDFEKTFDRINWDFFSSFFGRWDFLNNGLNGFQFYTKLQRLPSKSPRRWEICLVYLGQCN